MQGQQSHIFLEQDPLHVDISYTEICVQGQIRHLSNLFGVQDTYFTQTWFYLNLKCVLGHLGHQSHLFLGEGRRDGGGLSHQSHPIFG